MMVPVGMTPEQFILDLLGKQNGFVLTSTDVELDYNSTTIGIPNPNSTVTMKVKEGGKFDGAKSVTFNRVHLGNDFFQGINLRIGRDVNKSTVWDYFEPFIQERNLPIQKSDLLLPDAVVDRTGNAFTVQINPLASLVFYGSATIELVKGESLDLTDLIMSTDVDLFSAPVMATPDFRFDVHALAQLLIKVNASNGTNIQASWVDFSVDIPQDNLGSYNTIARLTAKAGNAGGVTGSVDIRYNRVDLTEQFAGIELEVSGSPENTDRYRRFQDILEANGFPTTNLPIAMVGASDETGGENPFVVSMLANKSWLYTGTIEFSIMDNTTLAGIWSKNRIKDLSLPGYQPGAKTAIQLLTHPLMAGESPSGRSVVNELMDAFGETPISDVVYDMAAMSTYPALQGLPTLLNELVPGPWTFTRASDDQSQPAPGDFNLAYATIRYCGRPDYQQGHRHDRDFVCVVEMHPAGNTKFSGQALLYWNSKMDLTAATRPKFMPDNALANEAKAAIINAETQYPGRISGFGYVLRHGDYILPSPQPEKFNLVGQPILDLFKAAMPDVNWEAWFDPETGESIAKDNNMAWGYLTYSGVPDANYGHRTDASWVIQFQPDWEFCKNYQNVAEFYWK